MWTSRYQWCNTSATYVDTTHDARIQCDKVHEMQSGLICIREFAGVGAHRPCLVWNWPSCKTKGLMHTTFSNTEKISQKHQLNSVAFETTLSALVRSDTVIGLLLHVHLPRCRTGLCIRIQSNTELDFVLIH